MVNSTFIGQSWGEIIRKEAQSPFPILETVNLSENNNRFRSFHKKEV